MLNVLRSIPFSRFGDFPDAVSVNRFPVPLVCILVPSVITQNDMFSFLISFETRFLVSVFASICYMTEGELEFLIFLLLCSKCRITGIICQ